MVRRPSDRAFTPATPPRPARGLRPGSLLSHLSHGAAGIVGRRRDKRFARFRRHRRQGELSVSAGRTRTQSLPCTLELPNRRRFLGVWGRSLYPAYSWDYRRNPRSSHCCMAPLPRCSEPAWHSYPRCSSPRLPSKSPTASFLIQIVLGEFFQLLGLCLIVRGVTGRRPWFFSAAAVPFAFCLYTYHAAKLAPLVVLPFLVAALRLPAASPPTRMARNRGGHPVPAFPHPRCAVVQQRPRSTHRPVGRNLALVDPFHRKAVCGRSGTPCGAP